MVTYTDGTVTQAQFTCDLGFTLKGASSLKCSGGGTWDQQEPECGKRLCLIVTTNIVIVTY